MPPKIWVPYARVAKALRFAWQKGQGPVRYCGVDRDCEGGIA